MSNKEELVDDIDNNVESKNNKKSGIIKRNCNNTNKKHVKGREK